ncbi:CBS domain-containing protein [Streptococcus pseudoporcinus]|uniref:5'-AMP-activated protein kinase subunit gamma-3 n=1 Tax=Streptococcus pseudoporcinus TaxID=361101 RepID=A0A4U9XZ38_9STRE|nr:CBS domain-containing protein [Streptococcus pseudoporcinus]VTS18566.1 5'-AMP-activated protein kinase subunit gamma-3 [Streptococcus pseudoporcinus]VUC68650.1 5'-AMP-activated protein kinase subunit gamma-3 [Streptococcus pseudoporcinus]VUC99364.1 5'-AMP-activated protein kinase subunit gamma-3 [Streptococcus pseudoporcinus]VUC99756.1 5'-AMP-activated protein kinase subunit gamma-3 [Streptococcus pseudoporcinus]
MAVKDYMTKEVVTITPNTGVAQAADIMRDQDIRRLPVMEKGRLVGLVTAGTMAEATPSKATSLSIYEMNYLLNKTKIKDIMLKKVITITPDASLEDAIYLMLEHKIGVLPVLDDNHLCGIITDRDVFKAFLHVSGYGTEGMRVVLEADNVVGILAKVAEAISKVNLNIGRIVADTRATGKTVVELQIDGNMDQALLTENLQATGVRVISVEATHLKANLD